MEDLNEEIKQKQKKIALKKQQEKAKKQPAKNAVKSAENKKVEKTNNLHHFCKIDLKIIHLCAIIDTNCDKNARKGDNYEKI